MIKAIVFDIDGTLLDTTEFILQAFEHTLATHGVPAIARREISKWVGNPLIKIYANLAPDKPPEEMFETHVNFQMSKLGLVRVYPRVKETLKVLKKQNIKMAAITNRSRRNSIASLKKVGIDQYISPVLSKEDVVHHKPHPEGLLTILKKLQVAPSQALMVGDAVPDVKIGKNAGVKTVAVTYGFGRDEIRGAKPDYIIDDIAQLLDIVSLFKIRKNK